MALNFIQRVTAFTVSATTITLDLVTPGVGNVLISHCMTRDDGGPTNPTNFITAISVVNGTNADTLRAAYRIAGASEPDPVWSISVGDRTVCDCYEYSGNDPSPLDQTASTAFSASGTSCALGPTGSLASTGEVAIGAVGIRALVTGPSWNNSYNLDTFLDSGGGSEATLITGSKTPVGTAAESPTLSWTTSVGNMGVITTWKAAPPVGAPFAWVKA